jgi:hypothetical protein
MAKNPLVKMCAALLKLHEQTREIGEHYVSYHALAAVLHAGESLRDLDTIEDVETRAREHGNWINRNDPKHPLSQESAAHRGHHSIFEQLAHTAAAARARIKAEALTQGKKKGRP